MIKKLLSQAIYLIVTICILGMISITSAQRGPSTPEERKRMIEIATALENQPLSKEAKKQREEILKWLINVPDVSVTVCTEILGEFKRLKGDYASELTVQIGISEAKFVLENPDKANDSYSIFLAGAEGVLRTYVAIKKEKPKVKIDLLEELLQKQEKGALGEHVKAAMTKCK